MYELKDIIKNQDEVDKKYTLSDNLLACLERHKEKQKEKGNTFGYKILDFSIGYTRTIMARYYKDGSEVLVPQIGKNPRRLTPDECFKLQGFPDSFITDSSDVQLYKQAGNSVTVPVIRAIANEMIKFI